VLERKAHRLGQCEIISICNADGVPYAAAFLIWDKNYMYYLIPAYNPAFGDSGASAMLVLEAMKLAREKQVRFDFEGSMDRGTAKHYKQFGSSPVTYFSVERYYKPVFRLAIWFQKLREWGMH
jgi:lipid II:glycine glycyltransferase (peptidoglycan interpeptide bridge formation enzyme)